MAMYKKRGQFSLKTIPFKWYLPDLNWGHMDFQSIALPTELRYPAVLKSDAKLTRFLTFQKEYQLFLFFI